MAELKRAFVARGYSDAQTYINSGNIIFSSQLEPNALRLECADIVRELTGQDLGLALLSGPELKQALAQAPTWWRADPESKHNAIFVIAPATADQVCDQVGESKPEYESVASHGQIIFWSAPLKTFARTRWSKEVGGAAYQNITIRNANTTLKLAELAEAGSGLA